VDSAETILRDFTDAAIRNADKLGLTEENLIDVSVSDAVDALFTEGESYLAQELGHWPNSQKARAIATLKERRGQVRDRLLRKLRLRHLDLDRPMSSVEIRGHQIGNVFMGPVSQSQVSASIQQIIDHGGPEAEVGRHLDSLVQLISRMDESQKAEQAELLDLVKALAQQVKSPTEERSPSTVRLVLGRIKDVAGASTEVATFVDKTLPLIISAFDRLT
jgi:hypothetical protein